MVKEITIQALLDTFWSNKVMFDLYRQVNSRGARVLRLQSQDGTGHLLYDLDARSIVAIRKDDWMNMLSDPKRTEKASSTGGLPADKS